MIPEAMADRKAEGTHDDTNCKSNLMTLRTASYVASLHIGNLTIFLELILFLNPAILDLFLSNRAMPHIFGI